MAAIVVEGGVKGRENVMTGFLFDFRVMLMVFVVVVAFSAPGGGAVAAERSLLGLGGAGCCGVGSLGNVNYDVSIQEFNRSGEPTGILTPKVLGSNWWSG